MDQEKWNKEVAFFKNATPYHLFRWGELSRLGVNEPIYLEVPGGVLPLVYIKSFLFGRRLISMPFTDRGGPLINSEESLSGLLEKSIEEGRYRGVTYIELRDIDPAVRSLYEKLGFKSKSSYVTFEVPLMKNDEAVPAAVRKNIRTEIHKLEREKQLIFHESRERSDVQKFYELHLDTMARHGSPAQSLEFFYDLWDKFFDQGILKIFFAMNNGTPVAAYIVLCFQKKIYHWASVVSKKARDMDGQTFLMWRIIKWAARAGFEVLDLGRARHGTPIYFTKSGWGGRERPLVDAFYFFGRERKTADPEDLMFRAASRIWRLLPRAIAKIIGPKIIAKIGL